MNKDYYYIMKVHFWGYRQTRSNFG